MRRGSVVGLGHQQQLELFVVAEQVIYLLYEQRAFGGGGGIGSPIERLVVFVVLLEGTLPFDPPHHLLVPERIEPDAADRAAQKVAGLIRSFQWLVGRHPSQDGLVEKVAPLGAGPSGHDLCIGRQLRPLVLAQRGQSRSPYVSLRLVQVRPFSRA